jgi:NarL family two-component system sensor histidine kinase LiaS
MKINQGEVQRLEPKKPSNMVIRIMGQIILFSIILFGFILYWMQSYGYLKPFASWIEVLFFNITAIAAIAVIAAMFGFFLSYKLKKRIDRLNNAVLQMEKGNLSRGFPDLGRDEIGRLAQQLERMSVKWEEQVNSLQRLSTHNAQLAEKARFTAIVEERQRLARELHDAVSQQLFAISMTATAVSRSLEKDFEQAKRQIKLITEMASVAQSEMRALLLHLRPVHLEGKGLVQGLRELIAEMKEKIPMEISFETDEEIRLIKGIEDHIFRIVQEALSNTLRHAKATKMELKLQQRNNVVRLMIRDNGVGFDLDMKKQASYGLQTIQERVNEIGGSLQILTAPGKGTKIEIRIPVLKEESEWYREDGDRDGKTD